MMIEFLIITFSIVYISMYKWSFSMFLRDQLTRRGIPLQNVTVLWCFQGQSIRVWFTFGGFTALTRIAHTVRLGISTIVKTPLVKLVTGSRKSSK